MKVALFARYSSKMQDEMSLDAQLNEMQKHCDAREWTVVGSYILPETKSSDVERSDEFQRMLKDAKAKRFQVLLVHKLDRFGRDQVQAVTYKAHLRGLGVKVKSVVENLGDGKMDRLVEGILEVFSDLYRHNLADETRKGHRELIRRGFWQGGKVPWGLEAVEVGDGDRKHRKLQMDPIRGPIMKEVFERVAAGQKSGEVLQFVEAKSGERWHVASLYTRLQNRVYCGVLSYGKTSLPMGRARQQNEVKDVIEASWAGIVSEAVWDEANAVVRNRGRGRGKTVATNKLYLLSEGVVSCAKCGRPIIGGYNNGFRRYFCSGRRGGACSNSSVRADDLESVMTEYLRNYLGNLDVERAIQEYTASLQPDMEAAKQRESRLRKSLNEIKRKTGNLVNAIADGLDDPGVRQKLKDLRQEESDLGQEIATCQLDREQAIRLNAEIVKEHVQNVAEVIDEAEPEQLKILLQDFFRLSFDLEKKQGQLLFRLTPLSASQTLCCANYGRSARI